jgi:hypothetical protein
MQSLPRLPQGRRYRYLSRGGEEIPPLLIYLVNQKGRRAEKRRELTSQMDSSISQRGRQQAE